MDSFWSKNALITLLLATNIATFGYFLGTRPTSAAPPRKTAVIKKVRPAKISPEEYRKAVVSEAILRHNDEFERCYNTYLKDRPERTIGAVVLGWRIGRKGQIEDLRVVESDMSDSELIDCVMRQVRALDFPPPPRRQELLIAHKFTFKKKSTDSLAFE